MTLCICNRAETCTLDLLCLHHQKHKRLKQCDWEFPCIPGQPRAKCKDVEKGNQANNAPNQP